MEQLLKARQYLDKVGWLAGRPAEFRKGLLARTRLSVLEKGAVLYRVGDRPDGLYGLVSGSLTQEIVPDQSGLHFTQVFRTGSWFGEAELFDDGSRMGAVVATRLSHCLYVPRVELLELASLEPDTWRWLGVLSVAQLNLTFGVIADLAIRPPRPRIAAILLQLAGVRLEEGTNQAALDIDITQQDIAHISNLARATVGEHLDQMHTAGLISRGYGHITLLNPSALRRLVAAEHE